MDKQYYYKTDVNLLKAASSYNRHVPKKEELSLLDCSILCLVQSFYDHGQQFYMSNIDIANIFMSCEKTVRTSINTLCAHGFLEKVRVEKGRVLNFKKDAVSKFIITENR